MADLLTTAVSFVVALGVLITVHEFGHFWVARRLGVRVLRFSVGFGRPLWKRTARDGTEYVLAILPLGGYVKMLDEREGDVPEEQAHSAFNRQSLGVRSAIVAAGPVFNLLFAILAYWLVFMVGQEGTLPLVGEVTPSSVAAEAGLRTDDRLLSVDGRPTPTWEAAAFILLSAALEQRTVPVVVEDPEDARRSLTLPLGHVEVSGGRILRALGVRPKRPVIPPRLGELVADGAGLAAGMHSGDLVLKADGKPIPDWSTWVDYVRERPGKWIDVEVQRGDVVLDLRLRPKAVKIGEEDVGRIGAYVDLPDDLFDDYRAELRYGPLDALVEGARRTWEMSYLMVRMLARMLVGQASTENLSGPISIAQYAGQSASIGFLSFLQFLAVVSISLGILNLLPIPVLDGGHLFFFLVEAIKGSPVSEQVQIVGQQVGLVVLLSLMGLAFYLDIERLFQ